MIPESKATLVAARTPWRWTAGSAWHPAPAACRVAASPV